MLFAFHVYILRGRDIFFKSSTVEDTYDITWYTTVLLSLKLFKATVTYCIIKVWIPTTLAW